MRGDPATQLRRTVVDLGAQGDPLGRDVRVAHEMTSRPRLLRAVVIVSQRRALAGQTAQHARLV